MTRHCHNHTTNLSAAITNSSVSLRLNEYPSLLDINTEGANVSTLNKVTQDQEIDQTVMNLLSQLFEVGKYTSTIDIAEELLLEFKNSVFLHNILGESHAKLGEEAKAIDYYQGAVKLIQPDSDNEQTLKYLKNIHNNMGVLLKSIGFLDQSELSLKHAIKLDPNSSAAHNNYGNLLSDQANIVDAQKSFLQAIELDPSNYKAYWNLHSTVNELSKAKDIIELCLEQSPMYPEGIFTLAGLRAFSGDISHFDKLMKTEFAQHPILTSIEWILSLPTLPQIHFNRWSVFDHAINLSDTTRPFYEFGVWMGDSFRYLMRSYNTGYGFDTFKGLPETWRSVPKGTYTSNGAIPQIEGASFIVGEFKDTLPKFFKTPRPKASVINFDADLYSSTLCALLHSHPVIDTETILVFDEFIVNENWQEDEFKALNEFCYLKNFSYEVLVVSLYTKQAVVRLKPNK
jgi:Tfp pilus assembly protein PilF